MPTVVVHPGETIFVTGVNGLLGSHIADQLLQRGYHVRGAVRDVQKCAWLKDYFDTKHTSAKFEMVCVPDMSVDGSYDEVVKGASGFIHLASPLTGQDADITIPPVIQGGLNALKACMKTSSIKSFVLTSSSVAASFPKPNQEFEINEESYNEEASMLARKKLPQEEASRRGWYVYGALKTETEKAMWGFVRENKLRFRFSSVLPNANFGEVLVPEHQGWPSTIFWLRSAFTGEYFEQLSQGVGPQYYVGVRDTALIHISTLIHSDVSSERLFAYAETFTWNRILAILRNLYPDRQFAKDIEGEGEDKSKVTNQRAEEVLRWLKGPESSFDGLEKGVKECADMWA